MTIQAVPIQDSISPRFRLASAPPIAEEEARDAEEPADIPSYFYNPPPSPAGPLLTNLVEDREKIGIWSEGVTIARVADIVEETHDVKTFRLVGEKPVLFSYRPGQFVTLLLNIDGEDVERSYIEPVPSACLGNDRQTRPGRHRFELAVRSREAGTAADHQGPSRKV
jgi:hypothetical protein